MQRIGKDPIEIPSGVTLTLKERDVTVKGPKGQLNWSIPDGLGVELDGSTLQLSRPNETKHMKSCHGMAFRLISNMITGVTKGFRRELEIQGVGYRAQMEGKRLKLDLQFSHDLYFDPPEGVSLETPKPTTIIVSGIDKQKVGQAAAHIRGYRPPEPYKGKGIRYVGEYVRRKEGKSGKK
ncbi:50S ribosomal protein L6 [Candidatus Sumerlaeota bacterium]|nr:50S ribosomal protein L6 [Candidatus Sumerlaeota bacterium]